MDFRLTKEQEMLMGSLRDMAKRENFSDLAGEINESRQFPDHLIQTYTDMGLLGMTLSPGYGGEGENLLTAVLAVEYLAQFSPVIAAPVFISNLGAAKAIDLFGSEDQKRAIIPTVCSGEKMISTGVSEPEAGADPKTFQTVIEEKDEYVRIKGEKNGIISSGIAEQFLIYAKYRTAANTERFGAVLLDKGMEGVIANAQEEWMGLHGMSVTNLTFDNNQVSKDKVVMKNKSPGDIRTILGVEHTGYAAMCLGIAGGALESARKHARERVAFGHPICDFQAIQLMVANMAIKLDAARMLIYRAATDEKDGLPTFYNAAAGKCFASEMVKEITDLSLQLFGGYGYSVEYPMERMLRDSRVWGFLGGSLEELKGEAARVVFGQK